MAFDTLVVVAGKLDLGQHLRISVNDAGVIHHFGQRHNAVMAHQMEHVGGIDACARGFHVCCRHTGRQRQIDIHGLVFAAFQHIANAWEPHDIGDLMRICNDRRHPVWRYRIHKSGYAHHGAFDMHMRIHKARRYKSSAHIPDLDGLIISDACDPVADYGNIPHRHVS